MTRKSWCERHGLSTHAFDYWRRKFKDIHSEQQNTKTDFVELTSPGTPAAVAGIRLQIGAAVIEVKPEADMDLLGRIVKVLSEHA